MSSPSPEPDADPSVDYRRIERAIRYLDEHRSEQPGLVELAGVVGLSEFHFQRLFQRWAGITPKSFLQFLTIVQAKRLLRDSRSVLDSSLAVGLSGPSRLHDLFLTCESMTPGEYKERARGMDMRWSPHATPFGDAVFAVTGRGLCGIMFIEGEHADVPDHLRRQWPGANWRRDAEATQPYADELASRALGRPEKPLGLLMKGTRFQLKVWEALLRIPDGRVVTYQDVAVAIGSPKAVRAVGTAVGANAIGYLIPCHRVIRASGAMGGYRWGEPRKQAMLTLEYARR